MTTDESKDESQSLFGDSYWSGESGVTAVLVGGRDDPVLVAGVSYPLLGDLAFRTPSVRAFRNKSSIVKEHQ